MRRSTLVKVVFGGLVVIGLAYSLVWVAFRVAVLACFALDDFPVLQTLFGTGCVR